MIKSIEQLNKEISYAEGLQAGFAAAQCALNDAFGGMLTLTKPDNIVEWERRERRLRDERAILRNMNSLDDKSEPSE